MNSRSVKHNALWCYLCNRVLASFHRHHLCKCDCSNEAFVDGGFDYFRYGAKSLKHVEHVYLLSAEGKPRMKKRKAKKK